MSKNLFTLVVFFNLLTAMYVSVSGQCYESLQYHAVGIPDERLSDITLDGDLSDWDWVPEKYVITAEMLIDRFNNNIVNKTDWDVRIIVGWSETNNWIYIAASVYDDIKSMARKHFDFKYSNYKYFTYDCMEIIVDADHIGSGYSNTNQEICHNITKFHFRFLMQLGQNEFLNSIGADWMIEKGLYTDWGGKIDGSWNQGSGTTTYEIGMSLWDQWNDLGPELSIQHRLRAGQVIGLVIEFNEIDEIKNLRDAQWRTIYGKNWSGKNDEFSDFILDPVVPCEYTWDGIKQLLRR